MNVSGTKDYYIYTSPYPHLVKEQDSVLFPSEAKTSLLGFAAGSYCMVILPVSLLSVWIDLFQF
jgi:hypothetical protein